MTHNISNSDDVIDSRDVIARIEELETDIAVCEEAAAESGDDPSAHEADYPEWREELAALKSLAEEGSNCSVDWVHGETLIRESYWVDYCEELCKDIGDMPRDIPHYIEIDWEKTADNIAADYSTVDFDGVTYYIRSV